MWGRNWRRKKEGELWLYREGDIQMIVVLTLCGFLSLYAKAVIRCLLLGFSRGGRFKKEEVRVNWGFRVDVGCNCN